MLFLCLHLLLALAALLCFSSAVVVRKLYFGISGESAPSLKKHAFSTSTSFFGLGSSPRPFGLNRTLRGFWNLCRGDQRCIKKNVSGISVVRHFCNIFENAFAYLHSPWALFRGRLPEGPWTLVGGLMRVQFLLRRLDLSGCRNLGCNRAVLYKKYWNFNSATHFWMVVRKKCIWKCICLPALSLSLVSRPFTRGSLAATCRPHESACSPQPSRSFTAPWFFLSAVVRSWKRGYQRCRKKTYLISMRLHFCCIAFVKKYGTNVVKMNF